MAMQGYITQLIADITYARDTVSWPYTEKQSGDLEGWLSPEVEESTAPRRLLEDWTGIQQHTLPPHRLLSDEQLHQLLEVLKQMLAVYNCHFVLQIKVPERIEYETIRQNFKQEAIVKQWHMGFFNVCLEATKHTTCVLGEYCQCAFFKELFKDRVDESLFPEEERRRILAIEIKHLQRKYADNWMKYYPYHLDPKFDDDEGNPYDYNASNWFDDEDDEGDNWWRR